MCCSIDPTGLPLLYEAEALECLVGLIEGEGSHRPYQRTKGTEFGVFSILDRWVAFDNRLNDLYVEMFENEDKAIRALYDGNDFLPTC